MARNSGQRALSIYQVVGWLVAAGVATCVGVSSYVVANEVRAPLVARQVGFPPAGIAGANAAVSIYAARVAQKRGASVTAQEVAMARDAFRAEPLSASALSLIVSATPSGPFRNQLLSLAGRLTRRNGFLNEEQIKLAAARGNDVAFFRWISRSVLTNRDLRVDYVRAMAEATARPGAVASLTPVIGLEPSWADLYWRQVLKHPASLPNAAKLRVEIAKAPWSRSEIKPTDQALISSLVNKSQFDAAHELFAGLSQPARSRGGNLLVNADFARQPTLAPFDWQLAMSGTLGATVDEGQKSLVMSAIGGARGHAARQLIHLSPGSYRFAWSLSSSAPIAPSSLSARISCAEGVRSAAPIPIALAAGNKFGTFSIADGPCRWHWLSIDVAVADDAAGVDLRFHSLSLAAIAATDEAHSK